MITLRRSAAAVCLALATGAAAQEPGDARKGLAFARETCGECHGVNAADRVSPRPGVATFRQIANAPGMTGTAIAVWLQSPHKAMPNLIVAREDRDNVIAYIISLREDRTPR